MGSGSTTITRRHYAIFVLLAGIAVACLYLFVIAADDEEAAAPTLSAAGKGAFNPQIAIDDSDAATIVWQRFDGSAQRIQSIRIAAGGRPEAVQTLSEPGEAGNPQIAFDSADRGTIVWQGFDGDNTRIHWTQAGES